MAKTCLKCGYVRQESDSAPDYECPSCGAIYAKVEAALKRTQENNAFSQENLDAPLEFSNNSGHTANPVLHSNHTEPVYEMLWRCEFCGKDKLRGKSQRFCPQCGAPQNPNQRYFPNNAELVAVDDTVYHGADVICPACKTANPANNGFCQQCSAPLQNASSVHLQQDSDIAENPKADKNHTSIFFTILGIVLVIGAFFLLDHFWRKTITLELVSAEWKREIKIEQFRAVHDSSWCSSMPYNAYSVYRHSEVRSHNKIADGQRCTSKRVDRGNGTFTTKQSCVTKYRDEPVYADKCDYKVDRWEYSRSVYASGTDKLPHDPVLNMPKSLNCLGCEREAQHVARYILNLRNQANEAVVCDVPMRTWQLAELPSQWTMKVSMFSKAKHCETLKVIERSL